MKICKTNPISIRTRSGLLGARRRKHARPDQCNSWEPSQEADRVWQLFIDENGGGPGVRLRNRQQKRS
jgi:hypothetical protein